ncbi:MAG: hypothetical protein FGM34_00795 [Solirubrobacteraceae bacterium]|nr:hypothetical protein [Solirubrobacteraceae bacterium]
MALAVAAPAGAASWERLAPGYGAYTLDTIGSGGELVFAGHERPLACEEPEADFLDDALFETCLRAATASQDCQAVGCHLYRLAADGTVHRIAEPGDGFGFYDVRVSADGTRMAAVAVNGGRSSDTSHLSTMNLDGSSSRVQAVTGFTAGTAPIGRSGFLAGAGQGRLFRAADTGGFRAVKGPSSCVIYRVSTDGPRTLVTGYAGTFVLSHDRRSARRIGPGGEALWVSRDGRTIALAASVSAGRDVRMLVSRNGGTSWSSTPISDATGEDAAPARFIVGEIDGSSAGDLWAAGGRRDEPAARVWKFNGSSWERVEAPNPEGPHPFSDVAVGEPGRPVVSSLQGIFELEG